MASLLGNFQGAALHRTAAAVNSACCVALRCSCSRLCLLRRAKEAPHLTSHVSINALKATAMTVQCYTKVTDHTACLFPAHTAQLTSRTVQQAPSALQQNIRTHIIRPHQLLLIQLLLLHQSSCSSAAASASAAADAFPASPGLLCRSSGSSPASTIFTVLLSLPVELPFFSMLYTTSMPRSTAAAAPCVCNSSSGGVSVLRSSSSSGGCQGFQNKGAVVSMGCLPPIHTTT